MVILCNKPYPTENDDLATYDGKELSDFQKWAIKAIKEGDHVLITAHTGSGKTLPAEFAIQYFTSPDRGEKRGKVIYASPIKALSNQKLYDFRRKFPEISFGIMTGDCKDNPEADVLIMTTEILRNSLIGGNPHTPSADALKLGVEGGYPLGVEGGIPLAAVIFDEVHYINDAERGSVWEQAILLLPPQVQLIMLSATIDRAEDFAGWIETEKRKQWGLCPLTPVLGEEYEQICSQVAGGGCGLAELAGIPQGSGGRPAPQVYLASTNVRIVPLTHYMWLSTHEGAVKKAAAMNSVYEKKLEELRRTPIPIASSDGVFNEINYYKMKDGLDYLSKNKAGYLKRQFVLNDLLSYLKGKQMLPAICFVFSRKQVEQAAKEINFSLFDEELSTGQVERECRHILQTKFPNYQEYIDLPEYQTIIKLLEKGIAIHHAGILPVLREMVELLFEKGFIKLLLATETFAVGLNMPTKTVIFVGLSKFNGSTMRLLYPHEYTQMAGRAGRRGKDLVGHVFHCANLFELPTATEYKHLLTGPPQTLVSKFKFSFSMALTMIAAGQDMHSFMNQSLLSVDLRREMNGYDKETAKVQEVYAKKQELLELIRTPADVLKSYKTAFDKLPHLVNSERKKARITMSSLEAQYKFLLADLTKYDALAAVKGQLIQLQNDKQNTEDYVKNNLKGLTDILLQQGFASATDTSATDTSATDTSATDTSATDTSATDTLVLTEKGRVAAKLQEVHPLALADLYYKTNHLAELSSAELAGLFSCFYPLSVSDELKVHNPPNTTLYKTLVEDLQKYQQQEVACYLNTGSTYNLSYDLLPFVIQWCSSTTEAECKVIILDLKVASGTFLGEFIKALLKVNAIAAEMEQVCEVTQNMTLLEKIRDIPRLTLKYVATNQSLYL
jgi:antiviral helicase SKI2